MAQFTPLISSLEYKPTSYEEYMQPYALQEALYQGRRKALDEKDEILAKYLPYINESTPEAKRLYDSAQEQLNRNLEQLGRKGWNLNPGPLMDFKKQYRETNSILDKASSLLEEQMKSDREQKAKDGSLMISYRNKAGDMITPNIDNMISGDYERHAVSGMEVQANAQLAAKALSSRTKAAFSLLKKHGSMLGYYDNTSGEFAGVQSGVMMDWLMEPGKYRNEIGQYLAEVKRIGGDHAYENMSGLFNGDFRNAMNSVLDRTDYDYMDTGDKIRLNNYMWTGAYQGLSYDERINKSISQFDNRVNDRSGGHGGEVTTPDLRNMDTKPQMYVSDYIDTDGAEDFKNLKRFLGVTDDDYAETGDIYMPSQLGMRRGGRTFYHNFVMDTDDYSDVDKFVAGRNIEDLEKAGFRDYFSLWNDDGTLISEQDFVKKYQPRINEMNADGYDDKMRNNPDFGQLYKRDVWPNRVLGADDAKDLYNDIKEAVLFAYELPKKEREKIMDDKSGKLFNEFVANHQIDRTEFRNQLLKLEDKYANTKRDLYVIPFHNNQEIIAGKALVNFKGKDGLLALKKVKNYRFKKDGDEKVLYAETEPLDKLTVEDVFGDKPNYNTVVWKLPANPMDGVIMVTDTGEYLLEAKMLGSMYPKEQITPCVNNLNRSVKTVHKYLMDINSLTSSIEDVIYKYRNNISLSEKEESKLNEVLPRIQAIQENIRKEQKLQAMLHSKIADLFVSSFSHSNTAATN